MGKGAFRRMINQLYIDENDNFLAAVSYIPEYSDVCAVFVHAYSNWKDEHDFMFCRMASAFMSKGISSILFDMRGHGESDRRLEEISFDTMIHDIAAAVEYARKNISDKIYIVTVGFSTRLCVEAVSDRVEGIIMLSPEMEIPQSLKRLAEYDGQTIGYVMEHVQNTDELAADMERMGMLPKFVTAELVNGALFMTDTYSGKCLRNKSLAFIAEGEIAETSVFENCEVNVMEKGGVLFRSPEAIEKMIKDIISFIAG